MRGAAAAAALGRYGGRGIGMMIEEGIGRFRKAAAASSEMKKKISMSRFSSDKIIRKYSTTAAAEDDARHGSLKNKSLYLCFQVQESCHPYLKTTHSIQAVGMSELLAVAQQESEGSNSKDSLHLLFDPDYDFDLEFDEEDDDRMRKEIREVKELDEKKRLKLHEMAIRRGPCVPCGVSSCVIGGSMIVFSGGGPDGNLSRICGFETRADVKLDPRRAFKHLPMIKNSPFLVELEGKLYRFGPNRYYKDSGWCRFLEVLEEGEGEAKWLPLRKPPINKPRLIEAQYTYAVAGTNILCWANHDQPTRVSRFDVSHPEKGWTYLNSDVMAEFTVIEEKLFVKLDDDHGFLMFSYRPSGTLQVFHMSPGFDSLKLMEPALELKQHYSTVGGCRLFHIEGQRLGLASVSYLYCPQNRTERVEVSVTTFEYQVMATEESLDVKCKVISTRFLDYTPAVSHPGYISLVGAYVL